MRRHLIRSLPSNVHITKSDRKKLAKFSPKVSQMEELVVEFEVRVETQPDLEFSCNELKQKHKLLRAFKFDLQKFTLQLTVLLNDKDALTDFYPHVPTHCVLFITSCVTY